MPSLYDELVHFAWVDAYGTAREWCYAVFSIDVDRCLDQTRCRCLKPLAIGTEAALQYELRARNISNYHLLLQPTNR